jgi:hypothetical protein
MPHIDYPFDQMKGVAVFSKIDSQGLRKAISLKLHFELGLGITSSL